MIRITRAALPDELTGRLSSLTTQIRQRPQDKQALHARQLWTQGNVRDRVRAPLSETLRTMAPGRERCMYCGDNQGTDVDHFEPLAVNPPRAFDWLNHLLACSFCNSHQKRDVFPRDRGGAAMLIDPTVDDPFEHLLLTLTLGVYRPLTKRGEATIGVFDLNRPVLSQGRVAARKAVDFLLASWTKTCEDDRHGQAALVISLVRDQPFAEVVQSMLRQASCPGAEAMFTDPGVLAALRDERIRDALLIP